MTMEMVQVTMSQQSKKSDIDLAKLRSILSYNESTGEFVWLVSPRKNTSAGSLAGSVKPNGYVRITIDGVGYQGHRLAWLYMHGVWPPQKIDHENRNRSDNRKSNLRLATNSQNLANACRPSHNTSGFKGVSWCQTMNKWLAQIQQGGSNTNLGYFADPAEAHQAYFSAARERYGEYARAE